jgi:multiple sugar transport system substrate-binding protein
MKFRKIIVTAIVVIFFLNLLGGCTHNKGNLKSKGETKSTNLKGNIEISVSNDKFGEFLKGTIIPDFKKKNPHVIVSLSDDKDIDKRVASGKVPDIYIGNNVYEAMNYGDMNKLVDFQKIKGFESDLYKKISNEFIVKKQKSNEIYCIPWVVTTQLMAYNKALFREAGLDENKPPNTFDDLLKCARKIYNLPNRADGSKVYGISVLNSNNSNPISNWERLSPFYYNINDKKYGLYNNTGTDIVFDKPQAKLLELFIFISKAQDFANINLKTNNWQNTGMWLQYGDEQNKDETDIGIAKIPVESKNSISYSTLKEKDIMIFKTNTKQQDLAWNFVKYMMDEQENLKACKELNELPVLSKLKKNDYFNKGINKKYMQQLNNAIPIEPYPSIEKVTESLQQTYMDYSVNRTITPQAAIKSAADKSRDIIKNSGK